MIVALGRRVTDYAIAHAFIKPEDREFYEYAYPLAFSYLITWLSFLVLGAWFGLLWPSVVYMLCFTTLRIFAGGVHAGSYERCYVVSLGVFVLVLWLTKWLTTGDHILLVYATFAASVLVVGSIAPVQDANKPLDRREKTKYSNCVKVILTIQMASLAIMQFCHAPIVYSILLMLGSITVALLLLLAKVKIAGR